MKNQKGEKKMKKTFQNEEKSPHIEKEKKGPHGPPAEL